MRTVWIAAIVVGVVATQGGAQTGATCVRPREACAAFDTFLGALNRREWPAFQATLSDSITVIVDAAEIAERQDSRAAAEAVFRQLFPADLRTPTNPPPPILPIGLRAQDFGDVVIVSFQIQNPGRLARRTIVLHRDKPGWRVVHIHGSSQPVVPK